MSGRGLGPAAIREFATRHIFTSDDISAIVADPAARNLWSVRAFIKAGFKVAKTVRLEGETVNRHVVRLNQTGKIKFPKERLENKL